MVMTLAVPSDYAVMMMKEEGLIVPAHVNKMPNFKCVHPDHIDVYFDKAASTGPLAMGHNGHQS